MDLAISMVSATKGDKLKDAQQWRTWYHRIKLFATEYGIWDLCDPDLSEDDLVQPLEEPERPEYPHSGGKDAKAEWRDLMDVYKYEQAGWEKQRKALREINHTISMLVDPTLHVSLVPYDTPYQRLKYLKGRFARSGAYREELRTRWVMNSMAPPKKGIDVLTWVDEWNNLREEAVSAGLDAEIRNASYDFLRAVKNVLPVWWQGRYQEMVIQEKNVDIKELIESFRGMYQEINPRTMPSSTMSKAAFSTWQGHEEASKDDQKQQKKKESKDFKDRFCPCGARHKPEKCYILNESIRPENWIISKKRQINIKKALSQEPEWKAWVERRLKENGIDRASNDPRDSCEEAGTTNAVLPVQMGWNCCTVAMSASVRNDQSMKAEWALDNASSVHVCNDRSRFTTFKAQKSKLLTGDSQTPILGHGTAHFTGIDPQSGKLRVVTLTDAVYSPGFHLSLVSFSKLRRSGAKWDVDNDCIRDELGNTIVSLHEKEKYGLWIFDQPTKKQLRSAPKTLPAFNAFSTLPQSNRTSVKPLESKGSAELWHRRLGHVYTGAIKKLPGLVDGIVIEGSQEKGDGEPQTTCEVCKLCQAPRQISRRPIGQTFGRFGQVYYDLVYIQRGYNDHQWITHFYVSGIRFHWAQTHERKNECQIAVKNFIALAKNWWKLPIKAFLSDNEKSAGILVDDFLMGVGVIVLHTPNGQPEQNGPGERSGGVIVQRSRLLLKEGNLPLEMWPEAVGATIHLLNRTPTYLEKEKKWIVPWEEARRGFAGDRMPRTNLANIKLYGSLAYCRVQKIKQSDKMRPRAEIGFLVGYVASDVWKIWFPQRGKVQFVRDAVFDETRKYSEDFQPDEPAKMPIPKPPAILTRTEAFQALQQTLGINSAPVQPEERRRNRDEDDTQQNDDQDAEPEDSQQRQDVVPSAVQQSKTPHIFSPELSDEDPEGRGSVESATDQGVGRVLEEQEHTPAPTVEDQVSDPTADETVDDVHVVPTPLAPRDIEGNVDTSNIVTGSRTRKTRDNRYAYATVSAEDEPPTVLQAFATGLYAEKPQQRHRDDLPPPPRNWKEVMKHPFRDAFVEAAGREIKGLEEKETFRALPRPTDRGKQILPLTWVFTYKFNQDGFLLKCKARICVRGDLQTISAEEKRAATLAARTARMMFALVAAFNLDLRQRDAVNAFLNSRLSKDCEIFTELPEGFRSHGKCWLLLRALYGLRISPRLWQQEASAVLLKLGLSQLPEDPCVFVTDGILVFFYVDDILIASHPAARERARQLERDLEQHWALTDHGDAEWFLNIRIIRDRSRHKLWLCQDSYITSVAHRYNLTERAPVYTPLPVEDLKPFGGIATPQEIHLYQQKVGSAQYSTTTTRVDAAKATAKLAQFLMNPGPEHCHAIDRVICYLYTTRYLALEYGTLEDGVETVQIASDASYGDHPDRKSSAGYICQVYGGPVDWKASKQPTVTTSTTEAELLGISDAGKTLQWWARLFDGIGFTPLHPLSIQCDNTRTVALITSDDVAFDTKLRHVDIHRHWLRQEVKAGRIMVKWVPTAEMVADGLTKVLPRQNHEKFVRLLSMKDIRHLIE